MGDTFFSGVAVSASRAEGGVGCETYDEAAGDRAFQTIVGEGSPFAEADEGPQPGPLSIGNIEEAVLAASL